MARLHISEHTHSNITACLAYFFVFDSSAPSVRGSGDSGRKPLVWRQHSGSTGSLRSTSQVFSPMSSPLLLLDSCSCFCRDQKSQSDFHARQGIVLTDVEITSFYNLRPDGVAFDDKNKHCVLLEFTRPMDSVSSSPEGDWAERQELEKNARYGMHNYFINYLALFMVVLGTVHNPTSQREHGAPSKRPIFKTGSTSSESRTPKPEKKSERSQSQQH